MTRLMRQNLMKINSQLHNVFPYLLILFSMKIVQKDTKITEKITKIKITSLPK